MTSPLAPDRRRGKVVSVSTMAAESFTVKPNRPTKCTNPECGNSNNDNFTYIRSDSRHDNGTGQDVGNLDQTTLTQIDVWKCNDCQQITRIESELAS